MVVVQQLTGVDEVSVAFWRPLRWPGGKASASRVADLGSIHGLVSRSSLEWLENCFFSCYPAGYNPLLPRPVVAVARYCRSPFFFLFLFFVFFLIVCVCVLHFFIMYINLYWRENLLHKEKGRLPVEVFATSPGIGTRNPVHWRQAWRPIVVNLPGSFVRLSRYSRTMLKLVGAIVGCGNNGLRQQRAAAIVGWPHPARGLALQGQCWDRLAWRQYTVSGWNRNFDLQLLSQGRSTIVWADLSLGYT